MVPHVSLASAHALTPQGEGRGLHDGKIDATVGVSAKLLQSLAQPMKAPRCLNMCVSCEQVLQVNPKALGPCQTALRPPVGTTAGTTEKTRSMLLPPAAA